MHHQHILTFWTLVAITGVFNLSVICALVWFGRDRLNFLHWLQRQRPQDIHWVTQIRDHRRTWRARAPSLVVTAQSHTGTRINFAISHLYWRLQDVLFDLSLPFQPIALIYRNTSGWYERYRKRSVALNLRLVGFLTLILAALASKSGRQAKNPVIWGLKQPSWPPR